MASSMSDPKLKAISKTTFTRKEVSDSLMRLLCRLNYRSSVRRSSAERSGRALWNVALASDYIRRCARCLHSPKALLCPRRELRPIHTRPPSHHSSGSRSCALENSPSYSIVSGDPRRARSLSKSASRF